MLILHVSSYAWICMLAIAPLLFDKTAAIAVDDAQEINEDVLENGKLIFAHVIYRHGDRVIIDPFPTDPWGKPEFWPVPWGELTNLGKRQHYELGQWLHRRYKSILNSTFSPDDIYIRSTDFDRTLMSALSNLAGLYPPKGSQIWNKDLAWQPIPVHTVANERDNILNNHAPCAAFDQNLQNLMKTETFVNLYSRYKYLFDYLTEHTGRVIDTTTQASYVNNSFYIEELYNRTLPAWAKKVYPSVDLTYITNFDFGIATYTKAMARLRAGPLLKDIFQRMSKKSQGLLKPDRKLHIYSAHDTTVANVLGDLRIFELHSPPYAAAVLIELREDEENNHYVSVFYKNSSEARLLPIPNCGAACPLENFLELYKDIIPDDWHKECKVATFSLSYEDANMGMAMGILFILLSALVIVLCIGMMFNKRRNYKNITYHSEYA